jgi:hypothetical protein
MSKLSLKDIKNGSLISNIRDVTIEFPLPDGEIGEVDVRIKELAFAESERFRKRLGEQDDSVIPEWIAKSLVDEDGKVMFTKKQVEDNFIQALANAIFDEIYGAKSLKKYLDKKAEVEGKSQKKTSSSLS